MQGVLTQRGQWQAFVTGLDLEVLPHRISGGLVGLEERNRPVVPVDEVRMVGAERIQILVDFLDVYPAVIAHAPELRPLLRDPVVNQIDITSGI